MIKELIKLSNHLDSKGLEKEANYLDAVIKKMANPMPKDHPGIGNIGPGGTAPSRGGGRRRPDLESMGGQAEAALEKALDEYYKLVDRWDLNLYSGDDEDVADRVIMFVRRKNLMYSTEEDVFAAARKGETTRQADPAHTVRRVENKPWFRIIMTGLGTTHMSGLNNTDAKAAWSTFSSKLAEWHATIKE